ncbi:Hypothetical protein CINCED_3A021294 [Cinara cedri]|uniref:Uncharacterized protein n=1 Tax=Cinara cedri TaxID=506608 RepID=A0A5E4N160_9HEMI|nr:Hypothetical protein CINCED_3A021294 [Cinara cedri]
MSENFGDAVQPTELKTITVEKKEMAERKIAIPKKKQNTKTKATENNEPETKTDETNETTTRDVYTAGTSFGANQNIVNTSGTMLSANHDNIVNTISNQTDSNNEKHILRNIKVEPLDTESDSWTDGNIKMELEDPEYSDTPYNVTQDQMDTIDVNHLVNIKSEPTEVEFPENRNGHSSYEYVQEVQHFAGTSNFPMTNIKVEPMEVVHDYQTEYPNVPHQSQYLQYAFPPQFINQPLDLFPIELYYHQYISNFHLQQALNFQRPFQTFNWTFTREVAPPSPPPALAIQPQFNDHFAVQMLPPLVEPQEGNLRPTRKRRTPSAAFGSAEAAAAAAAAATDTAVADIDTATAAVEIDKKKKRN